MNKKVFSNFLYQASYQLLLVIMPIITIPIISRALGPSGIGIYQYVFSIASYFVLIAGLGLQNYGVREIAVVRSDKYNLSKRFWELFFLNMYFSLAVLIIYLIAISFFENSFLFFIQGTVVLSCMFDITWFFGGLEDFKTVTIRNFIVKLITFLLIILMIKTPDDLILYFFIMGVSTLIGQISLWFAIKKYIIWIRVKNREIWQHLIPSISFFLARIAFQFYYNVSLTLLGIFATMSDVGYFSNGFNLVAVSGSIINALNTVMIPRMSNMYSNDDEEGMIVLLEKTIHLQLYFSIAITFGIITINKHMITWFYGPEFEILKIVVPLLAIGLPFQILQTAVAAQYLIPKKEMKAYNITVIAGAIVNFVLDIVLIPFIGIYGAIIGYLVSYILLSFLRSSVLIKSTDFRFDWKLIIGSVASGSIMWGAVQLLTGHMNSSIRTTLVQCILGAIIFLVISSLIHINPILENEIITSRLKKLTSKFKNKY